MESITSGSNLTDEQINNVIKRLSEEYVSILFRQKNGRFVNLYKVITSQFVQIPMPNSSTSFMNPSRLTSSWGMRDRPYTQTNFNRTFGSTSDSLAIQETAPSSLDQSKPEDITNSYSQANTTTIELEDVKDDLELNPYSESIIKKKPISTLKFRRKQLTTIASDRSEERRGGKEGTV